jgi:hypothetical protein
LVRRLLSTTTTTTTATTTSKKSYLRKMDNTDDVIHANKNRDAGVRELASSSSVSLDVEFTLIIISSETSGETLSNTINTELSKLFVDGDIDTYLTDIAKLYRISGNMTTVPSPSEIGLQNTANSISVINIVTAPPTLTPTVTPTIPPPLEDISFFGSIEVVQVTQGVAIATTAAIGASVGTSVGTSVGASVGASVGSSVGASTGASTGASVGASTGASTSASTSASASGSVGSSSSTSATTSAGGGGGGGSGSGSSNSGGDPMSLILLVQGIAITAKIGSLKKSYTEDFAGQFSMYNLQVYIYIYICVLFAASLFTFQFPFSSSFLFFKIFFCALL